MNYCIVVSLITYAFMYCYLTEMKAIGKFVVYLQSEIIFRFRDYTKFKNSPAHFIYRINLFSTILFILMVLPRMLLAMDFSHPIVKLMSVVLGFILSLICYIIYIQYKDTYY